MHLEKWKLDIFSLIFLAVSLTFRPGRFRGILNARREGSQCVSTIWLGFSLSQRCHACKRQRVRWGVRPRDLHYSKRSRGRLNESVASRRERGGWLGLVVSSANVPLCHLQKNTLTAYKAGRGTRVATASGDRRKDITKRWTMFREHF